MKAQNSTGNSVLYLYIFEEKVAEWVALVCPVSYAQESAGVLLFRIYIAENDGAGQAVEVYSTQMHSTKNADWLDPHTLKLSHYHAYIISQKCNW